MNIDLLNNEPSSVLPAFLKINTACRYSSLGRTSLYDAITSGHVKTSLIKKRGAQRGLRLVHRDSLDSYIRSFEAPADPLADQSASPRGALEASSIDPVMCASV